MQKLITTAALLLALSGAAAARQDEPRRFLDAGLVPAEGREPRSFVPRGWKTEGDEGVVAGDLNGDGAADAVLRLVEDEPVENAEGVYNTRYRALVILLAQPGGGYRRAAVATKLLGCTMCAGVLGDPEGGNVRVEIKNGVLNVNQLSGSREATDLTQRFRRDAASGRFVLIGEDVSEYDRAAGGGKSTSTNYLTGVRVVRTTRVLRGGRESNSTRTTRVARAGRFIEDVDYEDSRQ
jgi:opacity protein-like surface antigen